MEKSKEEQKKIQARVICKAWTDEAYRNKLINNPKETLELEGMTTSPELVIVQDSKDKKHFVIPQIPEDLNNLSAEDILTRAAMLLEVQIEMF